MAIFIWFHDSTHVFNYVQVYRQIHNSILGKEYTGLQMEKGQLITY